jgi:phosphohistidine phosphatase
MSRLILMRHAKSDWSLGTSDLARPLNKRGRKAAKSIGRHLRDINIQPDRILCSPSRRTRETLAKMLPYCTALREVLFIPSLYEGMRNDYLAIIRAYGADSECMMVIGHNSATHDTAVKLAAGDPGPDFQALASTFPTGATAIFSTDMVWSEVGPGNVRLDLFVVPRELPPDSDDDTSGP